MTMFPVLLAVSPEVVLGEESSLEESDLGDERQLGLYLRLF